MSIQEQIEQSYLTRTNRTFVILLAAHVPVLAGVAWLFGTGAGLVAALGVAIAAGPAVFFQLHPGGRITSYAVAVALMAMGALLVHASAGMIEMHFHFFVSLAMLVAMGNPWVLVAAGATVAVHHIAFWLWLPRSVFNYDAGFGIVAVHAGFVVVQIIPSCFIARMFGRFLTSVTATVITLRSSVDSVHSIAADLSRANEGIVDRAHAEVARMQETSATLERMAADASATSRQAADVKQSADGARRSAERGSVQMRDVGDAMASIREASAQITHILRTIDGIAFQTNILALNAAVEAARAGDAGAGFAVVAGEVRDLAQRAAKAARETAEKVEDASAKSAHGVTIIDDAAKTFADIEARVKDVDTLMGSLAEASSRQAVTAKDVSEALSQVHALVATSASNATNTAAACQSLETEASGLDRSFEALGALLGRAETVQDEPRNGQGRPAPAPSLDRAA